VLWKVLTSVICPYLQTGVHHHHLAQSSTLTAVLSGTGDYNSQYQSFIQVIILIDEHNQSNLAKLSIILSRLSLDLFPFFFFKHYTLIFAVQGMNNIIHLQKIHITVASREFFIK
jgi:hypothetical protein